MVLLRQHLQAPPALPGQPAPTVHLLVASGSLPRSVRAGSPLSVRVRVNGNILPLGKILPEGHELEISGRFPSGLLWLRTRSNGEVIWEVTRANASGGRRKGDVVRFRGKELARRVPPGTYAIHARARNGAATEFTCHVTMESPVCHREWDLR